MLVIATKSFYEKTNDIVFKSLSGDNSIKKADDFQINNENQISSNYKKINFFSQNKQISINLNNQTLDLLQNHFSKDDFLYLEDGSIGLSGSANAYVDGWFKDIMQNRNFASADKNQNNIIEKNEINELKNSIKDSYSIQDLRNLGQIVLRKMANSTGYNTDKNAKPISLEEILQDSIKNDTNFDGQLSRVEVAANGDDLKVGYENMAKNAAKNILKQNAKFVIDPTGEKMSLMNGKSMNEVEEFFGTKTDNNFKFMKFKSLKIKNLETDESKKEELLVKFPEFSYIIQSNPNISQNEILALKKKQENIKIYKNSIENFDTKFIKSLLKTNLQA
ncbi:hypothetical protein CSPB12327_04395 [Campylobacter sp. RM12327]|uniref:hypothetical protein n=1 Tax=Campylobacter sputorum TaxID=206 RepID=UPI001879C130|nr:MULTISPECIES: hypothetical protein [Campylobacter]ASM40861.1 hypothetical protein CSPB_1698 [Campylobacter sputorum]MBE7358445.1 hypothetical protein [Campylobacter sp. RM11302]MBF6669380.1 hypothetical protein [Campylobacter sp. RM12327]MBF6674648.1 hypothetical protein [Campylobacter sp. RM13538]MBF6675675.1 hypothetical protein [Campylobacter sp. RM12321]